ncbi:helix-turn-helix domain-containing protein [Streptomyces sp. NPDC059474]|uniref:helix-turn-helix domain-containing protein n=1 Tax=unclassified Streptomyces TaxID=2593676 RepID=UPI0033C5C252
MARDHEREQVSPRRQAVLDAVRGADAPLGVTDVAGRLAVHPNTVRFHLDALVAEGRVERLVEQPLNAMPADLGFDPQPAGDGGTPDRVRLRHCPFLELAEEHGPTVCPCTWA